MKRLYVYGAVRKPHLPSLSTNRKMENQLMKTILCFTLTLLTFVTLAFVPNSFAQDADPEYVVRVIYFHPSDIQPPQAIDATLDKWVEHVQQFYAAEMERHGFGRKTFRLETDALGKTVRHYVKGKFANEHYIGDIIGTTEISKPNEEISEQFDKLEHLIYLIFIELERPNWDFAHAFGVAGGFPFNGTAHVILTNFDDNAPRRHYVRVWKLIAHELGHAFGLPHDFRDDRYIMSYGDHATRSQLSYCAAEWLDAHRYFNDS